MSYDPTAPAGAPMPGAGPVKPGKVQAIAIMTLVGGIIGCLLGVSLLISACALLFTAPSGIYSIVMGVMAIIKGSKLLGQNGHLEAPPKTTAIMQIVNVVSCDVANVVMGILILVFLGDPQVKGYYQGT